jgi:hypothetical protein
MKYIFLLAKLAWRGDLKLWQVFWIGKLLISSALYFLVSGLALLFQSNWPVMIYSLLFPFYIIFIFTAIWRCAPNCDNKIWMYLARAQIVFMILAVIFSIAMLIMGAD